ncbi:hypothetical protein M902_1891 [Bacteriovorax sp. BAL6_X]|uniref:hypothetical protein n=1 Tax=Bacteriovorax sp. BAL6_X TaxID=1201290 RepID=UPI00038627F2|nr:hypothetical protein [Bacteriovorax sp. BAL6_X]EPZ52229.1 hypothetical protein M902_1891 [Bacteriovorax sp. BAL6_X]
MTFQIRKEERSVLKKNRTNYLILFSLIVVGIVIASTFLNPPKDKIVTPKLEIKKTTEVIKEVEDIKKDDIQQIVIERGQPKNKKEMIIESFSWTSLKQRSPSGKYIVEVLNSKGEAINREKVDQSIFFFKENQTGHYKLKVSHFENNQLVSFGEINFILTPPKNSKPIQLNKYVMKYNSKGKCYRVDLPDYKTAMKYYVEIYRDKKMKRIVREIWSDKSEFCWHSSRDGRYYFRYKYIDYWGGRSLFSGSSEVIFPISPMTNF